MKDDEKGKRPAVKKRKTPPLYDLESAMVDCGVTERGRYLATVMWSCAAHIFAAAPQAEPFGVAELAARFLRAWAADVERERGHVAKKRLRAKAEREAPSSSQIGLTLPEVVREARRTGCAFTRAAWERSKCYAALVSGGVVIGWADSFGPRPAANSPYARDALVMSADDITATDWKLRK